MRNHPVPQAKATRPFLKWAGGKSRLLSHIIPALPSGRRLIESFVGGGAVFLNTEVFEEYLLGDSNRHLIELYRTVAERPQEFTDLTSSFFDGEYRTPERYWRCAAPSIAKAMS
jgi:DNA adenine methylase